jgi:hypothetical protein
VDATTEDRRHGRARRPAGAPACAEGRGARAPAGAYGALAVGIDGDDLVERGWLTHPVDDPSGDGPYGHGIERALVVDDRLLTVSRDGIETTDLGTLADRGWLALK